MTRADALLLIVLCAGIGALFRLYWSAPVDARMVTLSSPAGSRELSLKKNLELEVEGPLGTSMLHIRDGAIRFAASPCRHQICVRSGWHRRSGAVAACVPNRISILLAGGAAEYDGFSY